MPSGRASARRSRSSTPRWPPSRRRTSTCFAHVDPERARAAAEAADVSLPFGGVPTAIKELDPVEGWPWTEASLVYKDRIGTFTSHQTQRLFERGGVVPVGKTTASEFGGLNVSTTKINGVTHNPWQHGKTVGGSSGGSAAAVSGGLVSLATGGDGGGSIRIPAGYTGLLGMKGTFGRIPRGPHAFMRPNTVVLGNLSRSVRDAARYYDVCAGRAPVRPLQPPVARSLGGRASARTTSPACGSRSCPNLGGVDLEPGVEDRIRAEAKALIADHRHGGGRPAHRAAEPGRPVDDGQPGHVARRPRPGLAGLLGRPHRRGGGGPAPGRGHVQPPHRGGGRGAAHPGQRGDGPRPSSRSTSSSPPPTPARPSTPSGRPAARRPPIVDRLFAERSGPLRRARAARRGADGQRRGARSSRRRCSARPPRGSPTS